MKDIVSNSPKPCRECVSYDSGEFGRYCMNPRVPRDQWACWKQRRIGGLCGVSARLFEKREA
jgi:hypothetical protein